MSGALPAWAWGLLADAVLVLHFAVVLFVLGGFAAGAAWLLWGRPAWAARPGLRSAHLLAVAVVVVQAWAGVLCPLTTWENALRRRAGQAGYDESFVAHWLHALLFYAAPAWVFTLAYTVFGALVVLVWWRAARRRGL